MIRTYRSFIYALAGFWHAVQTERNLKLVLLAYVIIFLLAIVFRVSTWAWMALLLAGGMNVAMELINTSLERFVDAFERHSRKKDDPTHYNLMKTTKDVAAAAALVSGTANIIVVAIVFWPHVAKFLVFSF